MCLTTYRRGNLDEEEGENVPGLIAKEMMVDLRLFGSPKISPISDELELIDEAKRGSEEAFGFLVERYQSRIFRLAQNLTRNREDAEEVLQNAFIKAYENLDRFRGDSRFYTWVVRIAVNEALMKLRRRRHNEISIDNTKDGDASVQPLEIEDWGPNPEQQYSQTELHEILAAAIRELEPGYRVVFQLRDVEEFTTEETAEALSLTRSAVKTRLLRARLQLRQALDKYLGPRERLPRLRVSRAHQASVPAGRSAHVDR